MTFNINFHYDDVYRPLQNFVSWIMVLLRHVVASSTGIVCNEKCPLMAESMCIGDKLIVSGIPFHTMSSASTYEIY